MIKIKITCKSVRSQRTVRDTVIPVSASKVNTKICETFCDRVSANNHDSFQ
jgi:hypothetical protein